VTLHQAGDVIGAIDWYQRALKLTPWRLDARSNLGAAYARLGRFDDAVAQYKSALETDPGQAGIRFNLGLALYKTGSLEEAAAEFREVLERDASQRAALLLLADCELQLGDDAAVVALLQPHEAELLDDHLFAYLLGTALIQTNDLERGQAVIDRLFRDGESAEGHLLMGSVHLRAGDAPAALTELRKAVELNPMLPVVNGLLGRALLRNGEHEAAQRAFLRELEINPDDYNTNLQVGELKKRDQQFDDARVYIERALRMRPDDIAARFALAGVEVSTGRNEAARQLLEGVVAAAPKYSEACALLATVYYRLQRKSDGDRMRARVEELNAEVQARQPGAKPPQ
jgi:tetratricopeptide (TPR) repeat protein